MAGPNTLLLLLFVVAIGLIGGSNADRLPIAASASSCTALTWKLPASWYAGNLLVKTYEVLECDNLTTRNDLYRCDFVQPITQCANDTQCPEGSLCGQSQFCVKCSDQDPHTWYESAEVTLNVTESMLRGHFWNTDSFYNHTGVDLILILERWVWSPDMKVLQHDFVTQHRSTWGDDYDYDLFFTSTEAFDQFNTTHVRRSFASSQRQAFDNGKMSVKASSSIDFYPQK